MSYSAFRNFRRECCVVWASDDMATNNALQTDSRINGYIAPFLTRYFHHVSCSFVYNAFIVFEIFPEQRQNSVETELLKC